MTRMRVLKVSCCFMLVFAAAPSAQSEPTTQPSTQQSSLAPGPSDAMHTLLRAIDAGDRNKALACIQATTPLETQVAGSQVDMMLGVAKLQKAVRDKIPSADPAFLQMAIVYEGECSSISESITGDSATVTVKSPDDPSWTTDYDLVRVNNNWKLSLAKTIENIPPNAPPNLLLNQAVQMTKAVNDTADAVNNGQLKTLDDVSQKISEAIGKVAGG
jgi:hypothetical protein